MQHTDFTVLLPIIVTLVFALLTRNVVIGLFLGVLTGVCMLNTFSPISSVGLLVKDYLVPQLTSSYNAGGINITCFYWWICGFDGKIWRRAGFCRAGNLLDK